MKLVLCLSLCKVQHGEVLAYYVTRVEKDETGTTMPLDEEGIAVTLVGQWQLTVAVVMAVAMVMVSSSGVGSVNGDGSGIGDDSDLETVGPTSWQWDGSWLGACSAMKWQ